ncbi:MAG: hypothetical protein HZA50_02800 [Planctomycetes bacterium]|nr:hypothetical protein [Planctomycetota bacterium]
MRQNLLICTLLAGMVSPGCHIPETVVLATRPPTPVEAKYRIEKGKKIFAFVDDSRNIAPSGRIKNRMATSLNKQLTDNNVAASTVPHERLTNLMLSTPDFNNLSVSEIGRKLGADVIICVKLEKFSLKDEPVATLWNPRFETSVKVVDNRGGRLWPDGEYNYSVEPVELPSQDRNDPNFAEELTNMLADKMADRIAKLFYNHKKPFEEEAMEPAKPYSGKQP